ncbi:MAG TPA: hypothetical protein VLB27_00520, partial [candidate division Zixibacteria bacterium]|nr:hypothetical protein [candidate division Zixibacteria bacterium]
MSRLSSISLRAKLLISYVGVLVIVAASAAAATWANIEWRTAASEMARSSAQAVAAQSLHFAITQLAHTNRDLLAGRQEAVADFQAITPKVE